MTGPLQGKVALVAGATRGAGRGIAVELGAAGATVYGTGRTTREQQSDYGRAETIEDTARLVDEAGGEGIAVRADHTQPDEVREVVARIERERGRLDLLVNDLGGEHLTDWHKPIWEHSLRIGIDRLRVSIEAHLITSHFALGLLSRTPGGLLVELTDGTAEYNRRYRGDLGAFFDVAKTAASRMAFGLAEELRPHGGTAVAVTPGWLRSEMMLELFGVTEQNWRDATEPHFGISESPRFVGRAVASLAADPEVSRWAGRTLSSAQLAQEYGLTDVDGSRPDCWRYLEEVVEVGKPEDVTGYR